MLQSLRELEHCRVDATDGDVGRVADFLFDEDCWTVRYLVADTGDLLDGRSVLLSPISCREASGSPHRLQVALSREQIQNSPRFDLGRPITRQHERDLSRYYGYPFYWGSSGAWGTGAFPGLLMAANRGTVPLAVEEPLQSRHLRRAHELRGFDIQGIDDVVGHVHDFVLDDETWGIRYLVIDTRNWWPGMKVLVAPQWVTQINWEHRRCYVGLTRDQIRASPECPATAPVSREYERRLHEHYRRPAYWESALTVSARSLVDPEVGRELKARAEAPNAI